MGNGKHLHIVRQVANGRQPFLFNDPNDSDLMTVLLKNVRLQGISHGFGVICTQPKGT